MNVRCWGMQLHKLFLCADNLQCWGLYRHQGYRNVRQHMTFADGEGSPTSSMIR